MEMVSPPQKEELIIQKEEPIIQKAAEKQSPLITTPQEEAPPGPSSPLSKLKTVETLTNIETNLYSASISSSGGGTIKNFLLKDYFKSDSQFVNLIKKPTPLNLLVSAKDLDGVPLDLSSPWVLEKSQTSRLQKNQSITYKKEVFVWFLYDANIKKNKYK